jgi:spermidine synthase
MDVQKIKFFKRKSMKMQIVDTATATRVKHVQPFVTEEGGGKSMRFAVDKLQSRMCIDRPLELQIGYTKTMMGFLLLNRYPGHVAMIGLGGGSLAKFCHQHLPETRFTAVEVNPHVIAMRREFLIPEDSARFRVIEADGADFVRGVKGEIDVLLVDGYDHQGLPFQLGTRDFYDACRHALTHHGIMVVNLCENHHQYELFIEHIDEIFDGNFAEIAVEDDANVIVFASRKLKILPDRLRRNIHKYCADWVQWGAQNA